MMPEVAQANRSGADGQFFNEDYIPKLSMILVILQWDYSLCLFLYRVCIIHAGLLSCMDRMQSIYMRRAALNRKQEEKQNQHIYIAGRVHNHYPLQVHGDCHAVAVHQQTWGQSLPQHVQVTQIRLAGLFAVRCAIVGGRQGGEDDCGLSALLDHQLVEDQMLGSTGEVVERQWDRGLAGVSRSLGSLAFVVVVIIRPRRAEMARVDRALSALLRGARGW